MDDPSRKDYAECATCDCMIPCHTPAEMAFIRSTGDNPREARDAFRRWVSHTDPTPCVRCGMVLGAWEPHACMGSPEQWNFGPNMTVAHGDPVDDLTGETDG